MSGVRQGWITCISILAAVTAQAQTPTATGLAALRVIVLDQTGASIPGAFVALEIPGRPPTSIQSDRQGVATIDALSVGMATLHVESAGFLPYDSTITLRRGTNTQTVTLGIEGFQEEVVVGHTVPEAAGAAQTTKVLESDEIDQLPDDPDELQSVLEQMAGGMGASFRVDGFPDGQMPNREDIRQIRFRTNSFAADSHDAGRVQVEIVTRPLNQSWNGRANLNVRNDALNARDAFAATKQPQNITRISAAAGGPIVPGRTSLRLNVDRNKADNAGTIVALNPDGSRFLGFVAAPTRTFGATVGIDHVVTASQTLRTEYRWRDTSTRNGGVGGFNLPERATNRHGQNGRARVRLQSVLGSSSLNELQVEVSHALNVATSASTATAVNVFDAFNAGGAGVNSRSRQRTFTVADNLDFVVGRAHTMRVGFLMTGGRYRNFDAHNSFGTFTFSSLESYLRGTPLQFTQRLGEIDTSFAAYQTAVYWQDDYRVTPTLTLSVGVRQEMQSLIADKKNPMPRMGFTVSPKNGKTVVRGGYGLFYDWYESGLHDQTLRVNGIAQRDLRVNCPGYPDPFGPSPDDECLQGLSGVPVVQPGGRIQAAPNLRMPYTHQAALSVERPLSANLRATVSYQALMGRHQMRARDLNTPDPATGLRPEPTIGSVTQFESTGRSLRNSLAINLRYSAPGRQMNLGINYTLAQQRNHADSPTQLPVDSYHPEIEWGPSSQDVRHRMQTSLFLPPVLGLRLAFTGLVYQSGAPYNVTTGTDDNHDFVINDRPRDSAGNVLGRNSARGAARWGDLDMRVSRAFSFGVPGAEAAAQGRGGTRARVGGRRPGQSSGGRFNVEVYARAENVLNRVNFTNYAGTVTSRLFGQPTAASPARRVQLGLLFRF